MIYEFITPSDPITFVAPDDKLAFICTVFLSSGKAGCQREDGQSLGTMVGFLDNGLEETEKFLGARIAQFVRREHLAISKCFASFAYGKIPERRSHEDALAAISDPEKLNEFLAKHENKNRTSLSAWVKAAWDYAEQFEKPPRGES